MPMCRRCKVHNSVKKAVSFPAFGRPPRQVALPDGEGHGESRPIGLSPSVWSSAVKRPFWVEIPVTRIPASRSRPPAASRLLLAQQRISLDKQHYPKKSRSLLRVVLLFSVTSRTFDRRIAVRFSPSFLKKSADPAASHGCLVTGGRICGRRRYAATTPGGRRSRPSPPWPGRGKPTPASAASPQSRAPPAPSPTARRRTGR